MKWVLFCFDNSLHVFGKYPACLACSCFLYMYIVENNETQAISVFGQEVKISEVSMINLDKLTIFRGYTCNLQHCGKAVLNMRNRTIL